MQHRTFARHLPSISLMALLLALLIAIGCDESVSGSNESALAQATHAALQQHERTDEAEAGSDAMHPGSDTVKVLFVGDSLTAGLGLLPNEAFPAVLQRSLRDAGYEQVMCVNAGVSGDTSAGGLARVSWLLKQQPQIVVIGLGANDGMRGQSLADIEANLRSLILAVQEANAQPLLLGMHIPSNLGQDYTADFAEIYTRLASELSVPVVPDFLEGVGGVRDMNQPDGIHPTPLGHERLAANIQPALVNLIATRLAANAE